MIDCKGGAAIFETGPNSFKKFDANNEADAPQGYIVRSNFATTAQNLPPDALPEQVLQTDVYSGLRYARAYSMLDHRAAGSVDISYVIRHMTRDMENEDGEPYPGTVCALDGRLPPQIATESTISRTTTVSAAVFHGVRAGEAPAMTTMWAFLGDPKFTIAVPCWVTHDSIADPLADTFGAEIGEISRTLRDWSLSINADAIRTEHLPGIWEDLWKLEDRLLASVEAARHRWSQGVFDKAEANALHHQLVADAMTAMQLEMAQAKQIAIAAQAEGHVDERVVANQEKIRVAIYNHSDASANGPINLKRILSEAEGFECVCLNPVEIRQPLLDEFDLLIVPGGSGSLQAKKLGPAGRDAIQEFVRDGGGYLDICAGAYLASSQYTWSLSLINARVWDRVHWARGKGTVLIEFADEAQETIQAPEQSVSVFYGQGPLLLPAGRSDLPPYDVLATYQTEIASKGSPVGSMIDTHAVIRAVYGNGRVFCLSPHPEITGGPEWLITHAARWTAKSREPTPAQETVTNDK